MDILERIRNTTPEKLVGVRSDFDDDVPYVPKGRKSKEMQRIVKGATDLQRPAIPNLNPGTSVAQDWSDRPEPSPEPHRPVQEDRTGLPTQAQWDFIVSLLSDLLDVDQDGLWQKAMDYTKKMNDHRAWTAGRDGNASRWITNLKNKIAELRQAKKDLIHDGPDTYPTLPTPEFPDVPDGRYAVQDSGRNDWIFVHISTGKANTRWEGRRFVKIQASDELHPIRNVERRRAIFATIQHMGWQESTAAYGQHIGKCGRCGRTLTDTESRARGIGPDCWDKL